jgi:hypothetical protein
MSNCRANRAAPLRTIAVVAWLAVWLAGAPFPATVGAQSTIPAHLTQLRPIKGIAYDPKPSDFPAAAYFDSDFFNSDFTAIWGDDGQAGSRNDLETFKTVGINLLHLYNWNPGRAGHTAFLDAAQARGIKVMVPISNFTAQTIVGTSGCGECGSGYQAAFSIIKGIFDQVYVGAATAHPAVAMWGIFNEYDLNEIDPVDVTFAVQAILTLEDQAGIPPANRLPITVPVSDGTFDRAHRGALSRTQQAQFERATLQWLQTNPGKNVDTDPSDLPGAVLAILAVANALADAQTRTSYKSKFDTGQVAVSPVPPDFWGTRFIAASNPFRVGTALRDYLTSPAQFQSAFPGTTAWNTLPPLLFSEMGFSQVDAGHDLARQASVVLGQIHCTHPLAVSAGTPQGYFLGSAFFQHTFVDPAHFEGLQVEPGQFSPRPSYRVDVLSPLPQWESVKQGYRDDTAACP